MRHNRKFAGWALRGDHSPTKEDWQCCHCLTCLPWIQPWDRGMLDFSHHPVPVRWQKPACWGWQRVRLGDTVLNFLLSKWQTFLWLKSLLIGSKERQLRAWTLESATWRHIPVMSLTSSVPQFPYLENGGKIVSLRGVVKNKWVSVSEVLIKVLASYIQHITVSHYDSSVISIQAFLIDSDILLSPKFLKCCATLRVDNTLKNPNPQI